MNTENTSQPQAPIQDLNQNQSLPSEDQPRRSKKFIIILGIIIALFAFGVGGYFLGVNKNQTTSQSQQVSASPTVIQPSPTNNPISIENSATANWKTYTSTKANYSSKYPSEWPLVNVPESPQCTVCVETHVFSPAYNPNSGDTNIAVIQVFKESNIQSLDDYVNIHIKGDQSKVDLKYTTLGGEKAVSYKLSGGIPPLPVIEYAVYKNGFYYIIRIDDSPETNKNKDKNIMLFNEMLSTFKFD